MEKGATEEVTITKIGIKKENLHDDIKDFAETAMNELLGWYGYDNAKDELRISKNGRIHSDSNSSEMESPKSTDGCGWCGKVVDENNSLSSASAVFCSELCFSQSRRASFKKNKTCDWCRHVRHTVSYVDFQDGASQLQFCSDKCLNQYKMHIFCRETRAHLELHPHLHAEESASGILITPDLWLKNCKSPELRTPPLSPQLSVSSVSPRQHEKQQTSPILPLISIAHPSKLIESADSKRSRLKALKKTRKRLPAATVTCNNFSKPISNPPNDLPQDLRVRHSPIDFEKKVNDSNLSYTATRVNMDLHFKPVHSQTDEEMRSPPNTNYHVPPPKEIPSMRKTFEALLPPPTVIVPYPIILPLPIPIPIPIPIPAGFFKKEMKEISQQTDIEYDINQVDIDVVSIDDKEVAEPKTAARSLRKRKRTFDSKAKVTIRGRKI